MHLEELINQSTGQTRSQDLFNQSCDALSISEAFIVHHDENVRFKIKIFYFWFLKWGLCGEVINKIDILLVVNSFMIIVQQI